MKNGMRPVHPGEILREEFLVDFKITAHQLAQAILVPPNRITEIVAERRRVTANTALRFARVFGTTAEFWMGLQKTYELRKAESMLKLKMELDHIKPLR